LRVTSRGLGDVYKRQVQEQKQTIGVAGNGNIWKTQIFSVYLKII
jgi:hypothetical protein